MSSLASIPCLHFRACCHSFSMPLLLCTLAGVDRLGVRGSPLVPFFIIIYLCIHAFVPFLRYLSIIDKYRSIRWKNRLFPRPTEGPRWKNRYLVSGPETKQRCFLRGPSVRRGTFFHPILFIVMNVRVVINEKVRVWKRADILTGWKSRRGVTHELVRHPWVPWCLQEGSTASLSEPGLGVGNWRRPNLVTGVMFQIQPWFSR